MTLSSSGSGGGVGVLFEDGEEGVADLIHTLGYYVLVCMTLNTFEVQLPAGALPPFPA